MALRDMCTPPLLASGVSGVVTSVTWQVPAGRAFANVARRVWRRRSCDPESAVARSMNATVSWRWRPTDGPVTTLPNAHVSVSCGRANLQLRKRIGRVHKMRRSTA
jgi:hypothetical protein